MMPRFIRPVRLRQALLGCAALAGMTGALLAQESLLPPGFDKPVAQPAKAPQAKPKPAAAKPAAPVAASAAKPAAAPAAVASPVIQPLPLDDNADVSASAAGPADPLDRSIRPRSTR
jgi:hypothetical protein